MLKNVKVWTLILCEVCCRGLEHITQPSNLSSLTTEVCRRLQICQSKAFLVLLTFAHDPVKTFQFQSCLLKRIKSTRRLLLDTFSCSQKIPRKCITAPKTNMLIHTNLNVWRKVKKVLTTFSPTDRIGRHHDLLSKTLPEGVDDHNHDSNVLIIMKFQTFKLLTKLYRKWNVFKGQFL